MVMYNYINNIKDNEIHALFYCVNYSWISTVRDKSKSITARS